MKYTPVIGMEVHVELKTQSKMFCACKNGLGLEKEPNTHICPVCTAQPGTLPVPNRQAIEFVQRAGLALNCTIRLLSKFDRKNYFYPDIPKGYQISQYDEPLCEGGVMTIDGVTSETEAKAHGKDIRITRIHMEEDTGKSSHPAGADYTLVDFNRAGVPLMELVTEPDISTGKEARAFCQRLQQTLRYIGISDADMEKGQMRCEVNISLHKEGADRLSGTKAEIKNINSFRAVERAIDFEIKRQTEMLDEGETIIQETRGWDESKGETVSQRKKESAHDYRYFPEPDIPPLHFTKDYVDAMRRSLPELPQAKEMRFQEEYKLNADDAIMLASDKDLAAYFENVIMDLTSKVAAKEIESPVEKLIKLTANYIISELRKHFIKTGETIRDIRITPENFAELIGFIGDGKINSSAAQIVLEEMYKGGDNDPSHIIEEKNLSQVSDVSALEAIVDAILAANQQSVEDYKNGKQAAFQFLIGQVMKETKGKANPQVVGGVLTKKLQ
ncbi:MAG: Asp-tRNA(Asn)/Glu-tRNA(Gln) amidotransferase subunit GatB [Candidatus Moranbacteria bacterium]|nr:Asp-tRNA(Asn)/Glu-tRNA(Gln) amidotransferase subunit GatB [Candidatus Moranbacteria bacterium]